MSEQEVRRTWVAGWIAAGAVAGAVVALLLAVIATARGILANATRALDAANAIVANTRPIWELEQTNKVAHQLLSETRAIEQHATEVADSLETPGAAAHP